MYNGVMAANCSSCKSILDAGCHFMRPFETTYSKEIVQEDTLSGKARCTCVWSLNVHVFRQTHLKYMYIRYYQSLM